MVQLGRTPFTLISLVFDNNPHCDSYMLEFSEIKLTNSRENKSFLCSKNHSSLNSILIFSMYNNNTTKQISG